MEACFLLLMTKVSTFFETVTKVLRSILLILLKHTAWKVSKYGVFSGPYFPLLRLNTEIYRVNLRIQLEYGNIRTWKNSVFGHYSPSGTIC